MGDFLLGVLDDETRARVLDRLETDEAYFESMAALEDDLILRWHQGSLSPADRALFARAYADTSRRARDDEAGALLQAARVWASSRTGGRAVLEWRVPRWAAAAAAAGVVLGLSSLAYFASKQGVPAAPFRVPLSAVGQKAGGGKGYDRVDVPPESPAVVFVITATVVPDGSLTAELQARDRAGTPLRLRPVLERAPAANTLTITVDTADLPDGDYVLTVVADANPSEPVATQSFRVTRERR
jgi:hypothetical protein